jgi:hypothetical protein
MQILNWKRKALRLGALFVGVPFGLFLAGCDDGFTDDVGELLAFF